MLHVFPVKIGRLDEISTDLIARRELAEAKGWLGELEGIDLTLRFVQVSPATGPHQRYLQSRWDWPKALECRAAHHNPGWD